MGRAIGTSTTEMAYPLRILLSLSLPVYTYHLRKNGASPLGPRPAHNTSGNETGDKIMSDNSGTKQQKENTPAVHPTTNDPTQAADAPLPEKDLEKAVGGTDYPNLRDNLHPE